MALSSGFFNSVDGDRVYTAEQFGDLFDGLITDGVYASQGDALQVVALNNQAGVRDVVTGATIAAVAVKSGRGWFNGTWLHNSSDLTVELGAANTSLPRWDAVVVSADRSSGQRRTYIRVIQGEAASNPQKPSVTDTDEVKEYPLAYIYRTAGEVNLSATNVYDNRGTGSCPYVTSVVQSVSVEDVMARWDAVISEWLDAAQNKTGASTLSGNDATRLATLESLTLANRITTTPSLSATDVFLYRPSGKTITRAEPVTTLSYTADNELGVYAHRNKIRLNSLGTSISTAQQTEIRNGTFRGMWLGSYWTINNVVYRIVDFDYFYGGGNVTKHHVVLVPDNELGSYQLGGSTATGYLQGFAGTNLYASIRPTWDTNLTAVFGDGLLTHNEAVVNLSNANGHPMAVGTVGVKTLPMSEIQMYGNRIRSVSVAASPGANTFSPRQFSLYQMGYPYWNSGSFWLRDQSAATYFCRVASNGLATDASHVTSLGYRPYFLLGY